jgi:hypothetical protein
MPTVLQVYDKIEQVGIEHEIKELGRQETMASSRNMGKPHHGRQE